MRINKSKLSSEKVVLVKNGPRIVEKWVPNGTCLAKGRRQNRCKLVTRRATSRAARKRLDRCPDAQQVRPAPRLRWARPGAARQARRCPLSPAVGRWHAPSGPRRPIRSRHRLDAPAPPPLYPPIRLSCFIISFSLFHRTAAILCDPIHNCVVGLGNRETNIYQPPLENWLPYYCARLILIKMTPVLGVQISTWNGYTVCWLFFKRPTNSFGKLTIVRDWYW